MKKNISGIYAIINTVNSKRYIGSSKSAHYRWSQAHLPQLRNGNHCNRHLQNAWNKYGETSFRFEVIEECDIEILLQREGHWIEHHRSWEREHGYNLTRIICERQVLSEETIWKRIKANRDDYWITGTNKKIVDLYKDGISKNAIAIKLGITRSAVYSCLEHHGLYQKTGRGSVVKLTDEVKQQIEDLRTQNKTLVEIMDITGVSETQLRRTDTIGDGRYCTNKVKRQTYRTVTPEIIEQVAILRGRGMKWEEVEVEVGVSRFALHQNGITQQFKNSRRGQKKMKMTPELRQLVILLHSQGATINEISTKTGIAKSTIRLQLKNHK